MVFWWQNLLALNLAEENGPAPWTHLGGSSLTSGAGRWLTATASYALGQLPAINPGEIMIEGLAADECWRPLTLSSHNKSLRNF